MESEMIVLGYLLAIALICSLIGFVRTVWFVSIGYTLSIAVMCGFILFYANAQLALFNYLQIGVLGVWAVRLGSFLVKREKNDNYNQAVEDQTTSSQNQSIQVKLLIWVGVSLLYVCMFSPAIFSLQEAVYPERFSTWIYAVGIMIMMGGLGIESVADYQKSIFKQSHPKQFCNIGMYRWVRCPNYFGEMMIWTGSLVVAIPFLQEWWQWGMAILGWICIMLIMMGSTKRLEKKQKERYGMQPDFQEYIKSIPVLFPGTSIYSLENIKVYLE